jgi:hypothetical protein
MKNQIAINLNFNTNSGIQYSSFDSQLIELKANYIVTIDERWYPAALEFPELIANVFVDTDFREFIQSAIVGGLIWDTLKIGTKNLVLNPLINFLNQVLDSSGQVAVVSLVLQFQNSKIRIEYVKNNFTSTVNRIFQYLMKNYSDICNNPFHPDYKFPDVIKIPLINTSERYQSYYYYEDIIGDEEDIFMKFWGVEYGHGVMRDILDIESKLFLNKSWNDG